MYSHVDVLLACLSVHQMHALVPVEVVGVGWIQSWSYSCELHVGAGRPLLGPLEDQPGVLISRHLCSLW